MIISLILCLFWALSLIIAQKKNKQLKYQDTVISKYINDSKILQFGFVSLGLGIGSLALVFPIYQPLFVVSGIGAIFVMLTETVIKDQRMHIIQAGLTYGLAMIGMLLSSYNDILEGIALMNIVYAVIGHFIRDETADKERYSALGLIQWLIAANF